MLDGAAAGIINAPPVPLFPSLAHLLTMLAFSLFGGVREAPQPTLDRG